MQKGTGHCKGLCRRLLRLWTREAKEVVGLPLHNKQVSLSMVNRIGIHSGQDFDFHKA